MPVLVDENLNLNFLPEELISLQFVDYCKQDKTAFQALVNGIMNIPKNTPLPNPLPVPPDIPISILGNIKKEIEAETILSIEVQSKLVLALKGQLKKIDEKEDVIFLFKRFLKRNDLYYSIGQEIELIIQQYREKDINEFS